MSGFDEKMPEIIIITPDEHHHEEEGHGHAEDMRVWLGKWEERLDAGGERFGIVLVTEEHEHDENEPRNEEDENEVTALVTRFRRENRERSNRLTIGYASVFPGEKMDDEVFAQASERTAQFSSYMFGVRGKMFRDVPAAKAWLMEITRLEPLPLGNEGHAVSEATSAAIFYGSTTGSTELVAEQVQAAWAEAHGEMLPIINVGDMSQLMRLFSYDRLLVGVPTWNVGKLQDDWEIVYPHLDKVDLSGKRIAIFGVGDQFGYPDNFQDAMGILGQKFMERGGTLVGYTSSEGYEHSDSRGLDGDRFMGLAIDNIGQAELTEGRIEAWVAQVGRAFAEG